MKFSELGLIDPILRALDDQGYTTPTPIQRAAIPPALEGRDVLGCAQTGTGKTCAFAAPILQRLNGRNGNPRVIRALVLTPTRELALQIQESFRDYGKNLSLRSAVIFGGVGQQPQVDRLKKGVDILVATPGRLLDLHGQKLLDLSHVEIFVLDEADRMLDMGFIHDVRRVLKVLPEKKQTLFFSATMPPEVMDLVNGLLHDYARVAVDPVSSPVEVIRQSLYYVDKSNKTKLLAHLIQEMEMDNVLVFSRTKHGANRIAQDLIKRGITAAAIHGNKSQTARQQALADFKAGRVTALVATDIAARGIDIDELKWVVNYDLPEVPETYVHRIGRTGRAGHDGTAISFCRADERDYLKQIEKLLGRKIPVVDGHPFPMTEAATGVDPMTEARREGKENARKVREQRRQAAAQAASNTASGETGASGKGKRNKKTDKSAPAAQNAAPAEKGPAGTKQNQPASSGPETSAPRQEGRRSKRGVRQGDLAATMPSAPAAPVTDFVKPDPLASDVILDATARLLAPRPRMYAPEPSRTAGTNSAPGAGEGKNKRRRRRKHGGSGQTGEQAARQETAPAPAEKRPPLPPRKESDGRELPQPKKASGAPAPAPRNRKRSRRHSDRPRPIERSLYAAHQKDSTEQSESVMKPYYLSDD